MHHFAHVQIELSQGLVVTVAERRAEHAQHAAEKTLRTTNQLLFSNDAIKIEKLLRPG